MTRIVGAVDFSTLQEANFQKVSKYTKWTDENRTNAVGKALMKKYPGIFGDMDVDSSSWVQSLFCRMGFSRRWKTSTKVDIPAAMRKEIKYLFLYEIVSSVEQYAISDSLIINFDQTPFKLVQCGNSVLAKKNRSNVTIVRASDKRYITGTFAITLSEEFLLIQLIYEGKTKQSLPRYKFPAGFSLRVNEKHFSNSKESVKIRNEIIVPYVKKMGESKCLGKVQMAPVIMNVFTGQMTLEAKEVL